MSRSVKSARVFTYSALIVLSTMLLGPVIMVNAGPTRVFLDPLTQTVGAIGDSFTVNVTIADVVSLYGYELKLYFNSTVMNGTQVTEGSFLKSGGQTFFWTVSFTDHYNSTYGVVWVDCTLTGNVPSINGSGPLATIRFKSLVAADSIPLHLADVKLSDPTASAISHQDSDGTVTVVPEFASLFAVLALIVASLLGILVGKRASGKVPNLNPSVNAG
jgi:hypothetical protein